MLTQNCDTHPLVNLFHKPDPAVPADIAAVYDDIAVFVG